MKVLILNGSPSGDNSITLYTMLYIEKFFPECEFETLKPGSQIRKMEKDFTEYKAALEGTDLIVFCYPVYTFLVPSQLHRFIELMKENDVNVRGKWATQVSTSLHFYDITAHRFIQDNCEDLGLKYIRGLSADMEDLTKEKGQKEALDFFRFVLWSMENDCFEPVRQRHSTPVSLALDDSFKREEVPVSEDGRIAVVADLSNDPEGNLAAMIDRFKAASSREVSVTDISQFPFSGGCLGCFHCAADGKCIYRDNFDSFLREHIQSAEATVYAFTIKDHSMGYLFKLFDDRQFCNGHRTVTMGKPVGYLINGDLDAEDNLRTLIESRAQVGGNFLAGAAVSASDPADGTDSLALTLNYAVTNSYQPPQNFYGVGGMKIFRDLIYQMRGLMKADHDFYKHHDFYDFPQKRKGRILGMYAVGMMLRNKKLQKKIGGKMTEGMIMPYEKVLRNAGK